jgi:hypothetical protein
VKIHLPVATWRLNQALFGQFIRSSVSASLWRADPQIRQHGKVLLDIDSTDGPAHGQRQLSFFNGA